MSGKSNITTLVRINKSMIPVLRDLRSALGLRFDREVIEKALKLLDTAHANKLFELVSKANKGVIYAKRTRGSRNVRRTK